MTALRARLRRAISWPMALAAAAAVLIASEVAVGPWSPFREAAPTAGQPGTDRVPVGLPASWPEALASADRAIANARWRIEGRQPDWVAYEMLARAIHSRARLTGSFADFAEAERSLERAEALATPGSGPDELTAVFDISMHRLDGATQALDRLDRYALRSADERSSAEAMRGDVAFYRGDYAEALRRYDQADALTPAATDLRRGIFHANLGEFEEAIRYLERARAARPLTPRQTLANVDLAIGTVELRRGEWDKAAARFARADQLLPGYWLIEAHEAQALALAGETGKAIARFETIARRSGSPETMDALAALYRYEGNAAQAGRWAGRAGQIWAERLRQFPEAAYGHALEHELAFGDPGRALDLARRDFANRPYGGAATGLGWAWLANNRPSEALAAVAPVLRSRWKSAETHLVAAQAYALLGNGERAEAEQAAALKINPRALDPAAALIWFGH